MAGATVVIEAGYRSGSLNTATHARDLDRPIGVVPGPVTSGASAGCHRLLRTNPATTLVTSVSDVIELMTNESSDPGFDPRDSDLVTRVFDSLGSSSPRSIDVIAARAGVAIPEVTAALGALEAGGRVHRLAHGWVRSSH